jgi:hypothetical protein
MAPDKAWVRLRNTTVDIGAKGYDACFGYGRIDALRAVLNDTASSYDGSVPKCTEPD